MKNYSPNSFWSLQFFFSSKTRLEKSCWITLIIGMMSHQMSNVSFRVGDFNSFEESWSSPRENSKNIFHSEEIGILWNYKNKKKMNYGNPGTPATPSAFGAPPTPGRVHHQDVFFWWRHLKNFASIHNEILEICVKTAWQCFYDRKSRDEKFRGTWDQEFTDRSALPTK